MSRSVLVVIIACTCPLLIAGCGSDKALGVPLPVPVNASEFGDKWPLTVSSGHLSCLPGSEVIFYAPDGTVYAVNGSARGTKRWQPIDPIWKIDESLYDVAPVARIQESTRRAIFADVVRCEDENRAGSRQRDACKAQIDKESKLTVAERRTITSEGIAKSWPPLPPTRVNISPLIELGLQICD